MKVLAVLAALVLGAQGPLWAGHVFEYQTRDLRRSAERVLETEIAIEGSQMKIDNAEVLDNRVSFLFDRANGDLMLVNHGSERYLPIDQTTIESLSEQVDDALAQLDEQLAALPEDQRAAFRAMLEGGLGTALDGEGGDTVETTVHKTDTRAEKQGLPAVKYEVREGQKVVSELWVADPGRVDGGREAAAMLRAMATQFEETLGALRSRLGAFGDALEGVEVPYRAMREIDGFPVLMRTFEGGKVLQETIFLGVEQRELKPATFRPPRSYEQMDIGER